MSNISGQLFAADDKVTQAETTPKTRNRASVYCQDFRCMLECITHEFAGKCQSLDIIVQKYYQLNENQKRKKMTKTPCDHPDISFDSLPIIVWTRFVGVVRNLGTIFLNK